MKIFYFLTTCNDSSLSNIMSIVKKVLTLVQIIGPILCMIGITMTFIKMVSNPGEKKNMKKLWNSIFALLILFFVPISVNVGMGIIDESSNFSLCWKNANETTSNSSYIDNDGDDNRTSPYTDSSEYESGVKNTDSDDSSMNKSKASRVIFIGDSRTVQMYAYLNNDWNGANYSSGGVHDLGSDVYIAQGGKGLDWMKSTGIPAAKKYFKKNTAIVILMGVNDLYNIDNYITYVNNNVSSWTSDGSTIYYVSVNPCDGKYSSRNSEIEKFNSKIESGLSNNVEWIDTYSKLKSSGFKTTDGLHYDKSTYQKIYNYIKSMV